MVDLWTNTPNTKGPTRAQVAQFGDNYLLNRRSERTPNYYGYNFYHVQTDFEYIRVHVRPGPRVEVRQQGLHLPLLEQADLS